MHNEFRVDGASTIGVDFKIKNVPFQDGTIKSTIWDTAGQERYRSIQYQYYREASVILLVYDVTEPSAMENLEFWLNEIRDHVPNLDQVPIFLVGNKIDLEDARCIGDPEIRALMDVWHRGEQHIYPYETSAKSGVGVQELFQVMYTLYLANFCSNVEELVKKNVKRNTVKVVGPQEPHRRRCCGSS